LTQTGLIQTAVCMATWNLYFYATSVVAYGQWCCVHSENFAVTVTMNVYPTTSGYITTSMLMTYHSGSLVVHSSISGVRLTFYVPHMTW